MRASIVRQPRPVPIVLLVALVGVPGSAFANTAWEVRASPGPLAGEAPAPSPGGQADREKARELIAAGRVQEAADLLEGRVAAAPRDADALVLLGTARALLAQRSPSLEALRRAVALRPDSAAGHNALCMALARFGEVDAARASCEAAIEVDPHLRAAHLTLGMLLASEEKLALADEHFTKALEGEADPSAKAQASFLRGRLRRERGLTQEAIKDLDESVRLRPDSAPAWLELGKARIDGSDDEGAIRALRRAVELDPDSFEAQDLLGSQYLREGEAERALPHLRTAAAQRPDDRDAVYRLGRALRATGATEEATKLLRELSQRSQGRAIDDADVREAGRLNNEGLELEQKGDDEGALARYRAAVEINPKDPLFRKNLGLALCRLGRWNEAKEQLREVLRLTPGEPDAVKALYIALDHEPDADPGGPP